MLSPILSECWLGVEGSSFGGSSFICLPTTTSGEDSELFERRPGNIGNESFLEVVRCGRGFWFLTLFSTSFVRCGGDLQTFSCTSCPCVRSLSLFFFKHCYFSNKGCSFTSGAGFVIVVVGLYSTNISVVRSVSVCLFWGGGKISGRGNTFEVRL